MDEALRRSQAQFGSRAEAYRESPSHGNEVELARMLSLTGRVDGQRVLDVATGGGHTARAFARAGAQVVACDATRSMLVGPSWPVVAADAQRLPFRDASLDLVASRIAPHHFADLDAFAREAARVLAPGGRLYVFDLTSPNDVGVASVIHDIEKLRDPSHVRSYSPERWASALLASGLRVTHLEILRSFFDLEPWILRARLAPAQESRLRMLLANLPPGDAYGVQPDGRMAVLRVELVAVKDAEWQSGE